MSKGQTSHVPSTEPGRHERAALAVVGGTVVTENALFAATILVDESGRIASIQEPGARVDAESVIDASGLHVFPGGVDTHVHLNDPGLTASEDFYSGTSGAAAGGMTTVLEMPQTQPLVDSLELVLDKRDIVAPKAVVDFGLYCALVPALAQDPTALRAIVEAGAVGFKGFVCNTPEMPHLNEQQLMRGMSHLAGLGVPLAVHCESQALIDLNATRLPVGDLERSVYEAAEVRRGAETAAVRMVLDLAKATGATIHLVHMSDPRSVEQISAAKRAGVKVFAETCPHYLILADEDLHTVSEWGVCNPPLTSQSAIEELWQLLEHGELDNVASDHCAYTYEEKKPGNPWDVAPGINTIQLMFPLMVASARERGLPLSLVARLLSSNPARQFGLYPRKGAIVPGADADLVVIDTQGSIQVDAQQLFTRCPGTAYDGRRIDARVRRTIVRGQVVYADDGEPRILAQPGYGELVTPQTAAMAAPR
ncbi:allantoinase AllB [Nocardioides agariphilus]|uniref:allantoinase n=1 Tax=Nocardioides agariphilus TaxID=433664 RepID=A0A930YN37_9ACTN|nr:allantoinase AllB [Nocardioides agariphilus]MBF4768779.1 allantoinase AllB [Nocardioides agariphilus]